MNKCCEKWKVAYYQGEAESGLHGKRVEYKIHQIVPEFCPECGRKLGEWVVWMSNMGTRKSHTSKGSD